MITWTHEIADHEMLLVDKEITESQELLNADGLPYFV